VHCSDYVELIIKKLGGSLPENKAALLERHLSECARCRAELLLQSKIQKALQMEAHSGLSADFTKHVTERVLGVAQAEKRLLRLRRWPYLVPAVALTAVTAAVFFSGTDLLQVLSSAIEPLTGAASGAAAGIGNAVADGLARAGELINERASSLPRIPQPLVNSLLFTLLTTVPAILGLYKVFAFLRD